MVVEQLQPHLEVVALLAVGDGTDKEVDEPPERVLIHGVDVGQVCRRRCESERESEGNGD